MNDQELRDKLASEYADKVRSMESGTALEGFVAGWDAARANQVDGWLSQDMSLHVTNIDNLIKERDQLREQLQWSLRNEEKYKAALDESFKRENELRVQCEKLAEALDDILMAVPSLSEVLKIARENLTEYREKFKK